jgi:hypothetical protein
VSDIVLPAKAGNHVIMFDGFPLSRE